jgi:CRP-like cAMP-binding protein
MQEKRVSKGEVLLKEGQVCRQFYFILTGCLRSFSLEEGREVNLSFYFEDDFACDFESFRKEEPAKFYLVAMEDTVVYIASKKKRCLFCKVNLLFLFFLFRFFQDLFF